MSDERKPLPATESVGGDKITVDDITNSIAAIGEGAQVIVNKALSAADEAREREEYEQQKLAEAVARHAERLRVGAQVRAAEAGPFKSLLPYELADAARFFGRGAVIDALRRETACDDLRCRFVVLHGDTGIGKTSVLRAGLVPRLITDQHLPLLVRVTSAPVALAIKQTLLPDLSLTPVLEKAPLQEFLRRVADLLPEGKRVYVLLDQFEAFFEQPPEDRQAFIAELARCLDDDDVRDHWLISVRSSWFGHLSTFQPAIQPFATTQVVPPLSREDARAAILQPAGLAGLSVEDGLVSALIDDLGGDAVDPSRLQVVVSALAERLPAGEKRLDAATYQKLGGAQGIFSEYLTNVLSRNFAPADRDPAWQVLAALAGREADPATEDALIALMRSYEIADTDCRRVLGLLEANRLIRRAEVFELASDSLLPRIREWAASRDALEQARAETRRQVRSVRASALRGLLGGAIGFTLAYLITFASQLENQSLLGYTAAWRSMPGAIGGLLLVLAVDVAIASYRGPRRSLRWVAGALGGAGAFALAVLFHALLRSVPGSAGSALPLAALEGALWGAVTGLGGVWVMTSRRPWWQPLTVSVIASAVALGIAELVGNAYDEASLLRVLIAGAIMALCVLGALLLARQGAER